MFPLFHPNSKKVNIPPTTLLLCSKDSTIPQIKAALREKAKAASRKRSQYRGQAPGKTPPKIPAALGGVWESFLDLLEEMPGLGKFLLLPVCQPHQPEGLGSPA